jgi:tetratricopeptide (TPR) repeat protein
MLDQPIDVAISPYGSLYVAEEGVPKILVINQTGRPEEFKLEKGPAAEVPGIENPAIKKLTTQIASAPIGAELAGLYWKRAAEYVKLKMYDNAIEDLRRASEFTRSKSAYFIEEARIEQIRGKEDAALEAMTNAITSASSIPPSERILDQSYVDAHRLRADMYFTKGDTEKAMDDYSRFITLNDQAVAAGRKGAGQPVLADVYFAQASILNKDGKLQEAETAAIKAARMKPNFRDALLLLASQFVTDNKLAKAKFLLDRLMRQFANHPPVYLQMAMLYDSDERLFNPPKALDYYRKFLDYGGGGTDRDKAEERIRALENEIEKSKTTGFYYLDDVEKDDAGKWYKVRKYAGGSKVERNPLEALEGVENLK